MTTIGEIPYRDLGGGSQSAFGSVVPPGGRAFYVHHSGGRDYDPVEIRSRTYSTLNAGLQQCASGNGDFVYVLPGHAENVSVADQMSGLVAGTQIIGLGSGGNRPAFTFTAAAATFLLDVANVRIQNCNFFCAGALGSTTALTVTVAFPVSASGCTFFGCDFNCAVDTDQLCTDMITLAAGADDFTFEKCVVIGGTTGTVTSIMVTAGAVDRLRILDCDLAACATAQLLDLSNAACIDHRILRNVMQNKLNATTAVIKPHATTTGLVHANVWMTAAAGTAPASSGWTTYTTTYWFGINQCATVSGASALLSPGVDS